MGDSAAIVLADVTRRFGRAVAVDGVSLSVARGTIQAIVGPDGAGKTTLIRLICGAMPPDAGGILVDGLDAVRETARVQGAVGYMPQRFSLYPDLTVAENLRFYGDIFGVERASFAVRSAQLLDDFALAEFSARRADELSGGMKQKLALACALIHSPSTILLDEPTAGVDPVSRRAFWRILYRINQSGTTILLSTPYMDEAERADAVSFMSHGSILSIGTPDQLKSSLSGEVIEIRCARRTDARRALHGEPQLQSIEIFGDALHALAASHDAAVSAIERRLSAAGITDARLRRIPPSLEDAFVARLVS